MPESPNQLCDYKAIRGSLLEDMKLLDGKKFLLKGKLPQVLKESYPMCIGVSIDFIIILNYFLATRTEHLPHQGAQPPEDVDEDGAK